MLTWRNNNICTSRETPPQVVYSANIRKENTDKTFSLSLFFLLFPLSFYRVYTFTLENADGRKRRWNEVRKKTFTHSIFSSLFLRLIGNNFSFIVSFYSLCKKKDEEKNYRKRKSRYIFLILATSKM